MHYRSVVMVVARTELEKKIRNKILCVVKFKMVAASRFILLASISTKLKFRYRMLIPCSIISTTEVLSYELSFISPILYHTAFELRMPL